VAAKQVLIGSLEGEDPALELAFAHAMVRRASRGEIDEVVRVYRPARPMAVFGRRDTRLPGFVRAVEAVRTAGFATAVRATGGRAVVYTSQAVVIDHVKREPDAALGQQDRFVGFGQLLVRTLRDLGVDAQLGAVPGEYCPGAHSVNARGIVKLIGTAQRVVRDAWLFSSLVVVDDAALLRTHLAQMYEALQLPFDERSVGAVRDEAPRADGGTVEQAVLAAIGSGIAPEPTRTEDATLTQARELLRHHLV
jgi:octanoyl-[GcvH]:protein N-octanoyltransferase